MRREQPVQRLDTSTMPHEESKPVFMVYRHEEVQQMLRDNETFSSAIIIDAFGDALGKHVMLGMDEPEHGCHRALVSKAFSQKALARWEHELVGQVANQLIDRFADRGRADLRSEFTFPYPTQIIAGLLGLPREDYPQFQRWSVALLSILFERERGLAASEALREYFVPILAARRQEPRDDLISGLAQAEIDGERLSDEEIFSFLRLLLPAGIETTYRSLGNLLLALLSNPNQLDAVRPDRDSRHRAGRCVDPSGLGGHARARCGQPARRSVSRPGSLRHLPSAAGAHRFRPWGPCLSGDASGAAGNARCAQPALRPAAKPAARPRRRRSAYPGPGVPFADLGAGALRRTSGTDGVTELPLCRLRYRYHSHRAMTEQAVPAATGTPASATVLRTLRETS